MPRPALISRAAILDETLAIADERGLPGVRCVPSRRASQSARWRSITTFAISTTCSMASWSGCSPRSRCRIADLPGEERLHAMAAACVEAAARHPGSFPLLLGRPVATEAALGVREAATRR